jgi:hypothetical protein
MTTTRFRIAALIVLLAAVPPAAAQVVDTLPPGPRTGTPGGDSTAPPISSRRALLYGMLIPGSAQTILQRPRAAALFIGFEALSITMARKAAGDLREAKRYAADSLVESYRLDPATGRVVLDTAGNPVVASFVPNRFGTDRVAARRTHYEDWVAALIFNHLISGVEAFVAAQLWDLPTQVSVRAIPRGVVIGAAIPW